MRVKDIMTRPVYSLQESDPLEDAAELLADKKITAAPVLDEGGKLVGMVSDGDLLWHRVPEDPTAHGLRVDDPGAAYRPTTVAQVMSRRPVTTSPDADLADVAQTMIYQGVRSEPVMDDGRIVGIVSRRDIVRTVIRTDDVLAREIQHRLDEYAGGSRGWRVTVSGGVAHVEGSFKDDTERTIVSIMARTVPGVAGAQLTDLAA
jgi:CBS domain-containing protein